MTRAPLQRRLLTAMLVLYGLAVALMPFAHRGTVDASGIDLSAFALPDGTLPVMCRPGQGNGGSEDGQGGTGGGGLCLACVLAHAAGLEPPLPILLARDAELRPIAHVALEAPCLGSPRLNASARPRAPPTA